MQVKNKNPVASINHPAVAAFDSSSSFTAEVGIAVGKVSLDESESPGLRSCVVGIEVVSAEGLIFGDGVGAAELLADGGITVKVGIRLGTSAGFSDGAALRSFVGFKVGIRLGTFVGFTLPHSQQRSTDFGSGSGSGSRFMVIRMLIHNRV